MEDEESLFLSRHELGWGFDDDWNGFITLTCKESNCELKLFFNEIMPGEKYRCDCGDTVSFSDDNLLELQNQLNATKESLRNLQITIG